jgi:hypothetical protein
MFGRKHEYYREFWYCAVSFYFNRMRLVILKSNLLFRPEVVGRRFLQNVGKCLPRSPVFHLKREDVSFIQTAASESIPYESVTTGFMLRSTGWPVEFSRKIKNVNKVTAGHAVAQLVEALRNKPEGRGFDSRCQFAFSSGSGRFLLLCSATSLTYASGVLCT